MDTNEIDLDNLDNSDISSDWDSSEDEAPVMEVEDDQPTTSNVQQEEQMDYEKEKGDLENMESDEEPDVIPRTEHEISMDTIDVEEFNVDFSMNMLLIRAGVVSHVLESSYIIDAGFNAKAIEENSILFRQNLQPVGRIMEVFGQVEHPYYVLRWPKSIENPNLQVGEAVFMNNTEAKYILPAQLNQVGTDASNVYDEEPTEKERIQIECTEDVKGDEVPDESGMVEGINYQHEFVIPSVSAPRKYGRGRHPHSFTLNQPSNMMSSMPAMPQMAPMPQMNATNPYSIYIPAMGTQQPSIPATPNPPSQPTPSTDNSGLDILMNSYF